MYAIILKALRSPVTSKSTFINHISPIFFFFGRRTLSSHNMSKRPENEQLWAPGFGKVLTLYFPLLQPLTPWDHLLWY